MTPRDCCGQEPLMQETESCIEIECEECHRRIFYGYSGKSWNDWRNIAIEMWNLKS